MKEISEKLAGELMALIADAERQSDRAYAAAKNWRCKNSWAVGADRFSAII